MPVDREKLKKYYSLRVQLDTDPAMAILGIMEEIQKEMNDAKAAQEKLFVAKMTELFSALPEKYREAMQAFVSSIKIPEDGIDADEEDIIDRILPEVIKQIPPPQKGDPGKDFVPTEADLQKIADKVKVPQVNHVIEKITEVVHEKPIVTEITKNVANPITGNEIVNKINSLGLADDLMIDWKHIKNAPATTSPSRSTKKPKGLAHGGGTTFLAGTNVTFTINADGTVTISAAGGGSSDVISGVGAPVSTPASLGARYIDTGSGNIYMAVGTSSSADWRLVTSYS